MKIDKNYLDGILIGSAIFFEVCYSQVMIPLCIIFIVRICILFFSRIGKIKFNSLTAWLILMYIFTSALGLRLDDNSSQFSFIYNSCIFLSIISIQIILSNMKNDNFFIIIRVSIIFSLILLSCYLFAKESENIFNLKDTFISGNTGYRLGKLSSGNPNTVAWTLGIISIFIFYFFSYYKRIFYIILYFISIIFIFLTGSKNGLLLASTPIFFELFKSFRSISLNKVLIFAIILYFAWFIIHENFTLYTLIGNRIDSMINTIEFSSGYSSNYEDIDIGSTMKRIDMIKSAIDMFLEQPIYGWGIGGFAKYSGYGYYSHSNYSEILVSGGIVLFLSYYCYILYYILFFFFNKRRNMYRTLIAMLIVSILLMDAGTVNFYSNFIFYFRTLVLFELVRKGMLIKNGK